MELGDKGVTEHEGTVPLDTAFAKQMVRAAAPCIVPQRERSILCNNHLPPTCACPAGRGF